MSTRRRRRLEADKVRRAHRAARQDAAVRKIKAGPPPTPRRTLEIDRERESVTLIIPQKFCFLTAPEEALKFLKEFEGYASSTEVGTITFDFSRCTVLGLCAYVVLYTSLLRIRDERQNATLGAFVIPSGSLSVNQMINLSDELASEKPVNLITAPLIRGRAINNEFSEDRDRAGTEIVDYLTKCLATEAAELSPEGRKYLCNLITETTGNAEEHGGPWYATGYFVQQYETDPGECHLLLFNFGATISQSIADPKASAEIRENADRLADHHLKRGFFISKMSRRWDKEALLTLYALPQGVSSRLHERPSRGNGTVQMIKAFSELAGRDQRMCILSGSAYILFDGTYGLDSKPVSANVMREVIAFNVANDLHVPPDDQYVYSLNGKFPGTLVSVRFRLARTQTTSLTKKRMEDG